MLHKQEKKAGFYNPFIISNIYFWGILFYLIYILTYKTWWYISNETVI